MRHVAVLISLGLCLVLPSPALSQPSASEDMLFSSGTGPALRARLMAHADTIADADKAEAARAFGFCGHSFAREGAQDSSVAAFERAFELDPYRRFELADALLFRQAPGDAKRAIEILRPIQPDNPELPDRSYGQVQGLMAWAQFLTGRPDSATRLLGPVEGWLSEHQDWRYRMACVAMTRGDWSKALILLTPLALASRNTDVDVMEMLDEAGDKLGGRQHLQPVLQGNIATRDRLEAEWLAEMNARRLVLTARDGFPLGAVLLAPKTPVRARAAVVLVAPGDTLALYDSLAVAMRRNGFALLLLEMRGSGLSVAAGCPLPGSWRGREVAMQKRCAEDVRIAVRALGREAHADTSEYMVVGAGPTAPIAVEALRLDPRARVLMLAGCAPHPVDRGPMRAGLAAIHRPVYFQTGPEEFTSWPVIDSLYRACDMRASRVADSDRSGLRATLFRRDPKIFERFMFWLADAWPERRRPAPRPARPRQG